MARLSLSRNLHRPFRPGDWSAMPARLPSPSLGPAASLSRQNFLDASANVNW